MLITGGAGTGNEWLSSVEVFDPRNPSWSCSLPDMTKPRICHAAAGMTVCGCSSYYTPSCEKLDGKKWTVTHTLNPRRWKHVMWQSPSKGMMVMGGPYSIHSIDALQDDGTLVRQQWKLKYRIEYDDITTIYKYKNFKGTMCTIILVTNIPILIYIFCFRYSCSIDLGQTVVVTGGMFSKKNVVEYNEDGQTKELPQMIKARYRHGCTSFVDSNNRIVSFFNLQHG